MPLTKKGVADWCAVTKITEEENTGLVTLLTMNHSVLVNGVLASCFEACERWGIVDSASMRALYRISPSSLNSKMYRKFYNFWDPISDQIAASLAVK